MDYSLKEVSFDEFSDEQKEKVRWLSEHRTPVALEDLEETIDALVDELDLPDEK